MRLTALILVLIGGGGVYGGTLLLLAPDGGLLGLTAAMLPNWYRADFLWAGFLLLAGFGFAPLVAAALLFARPAVGWAAVLWVGLGLAAWIIVQVLMIGLILPPMQVGFFLVGVGLVALAVQVLRGPAHARVAGKVRPTYEV